MAAKIEILRNMIQLTNNSKLTNEACEKIYDCLTDEAKQSFNEWLKFAVRQKDDDTNQRRHVRY